MVYIKARLPTKTAPTLAAMRAPGDLSRPAPEVGVCEGVDTDDEEDVFVALGAVMTVAMEDPDGMAMVIDMLEEPEVVEVGVVLFAATAAPPKPTGSPAR